MGNSYKNSRELTRMTRIIGWFSFMAIGAAGVVSYIIVVSNQFAATGLDPFTNLVNQPPITNLPLALLPFALLPFALLPFAHLPLAH
jgi:hypothetical protein